MFFLPSAPFCDILFEKEGFPCHTTTFSLCSGGPSGVLCLLDADRSCHLCFHCHLTLQYGLPEGIRHAWLAWVPIGNNWILGSLSDQYRYLVKGKICRKRVILPALSGGVLLLIPVMSRMVTVNAALGALFDCYFSAASTLLGSVFLALAVIAILIVVQVFFST